MAWITSIFILVSAFLLFSGWARAFRLKALASDEKSQKEWSTFRAIVLITLLGYFITLITAMSSGAVAVANLLAIALALGSLATWSAITYFRSVANVAPGFGGEFPQKEVPEERVSADVRGVEESMRAIVRDMRSSVTAVRGSGEALRDQGAGSRDELSDVAAAIVQNAEQLNQLVDQLQAIYQGPSLTR